MAIVWDAGSNLFIVRGRIGQTTASKKAVDRTTRGTQLLKHATLLNLESPMAPIEEDWDASSPHQGVGGQGTMRAHHVADSQIQMLVCDYMNRNISLATFMNRLGTLYMTTWVDVIVTPRVFMIWMQWAESIYRTLRVNIDAAIRVDRNSQARLATQLAKTLSSSIANQRIGHGVTDSSLARAIAPRLHRGQSFVLSSFLRYLNATPTAPTLSIETTIVRETWNAHFVNHAADWSLRSNLHKIGSVFAGSNANGQLLISENRPGGVGDATIPVPQDHPVDLKVVNRSKSMLAIRASRALMHLVAALMIMWCFFTLGYKLIDSFW